MSWNMPRISVAIPTHAMANGEFFLKRLTDSLDAQTFRDFELVITTEGSMPVNSNSAIKKAKGEIVKVLYMDDYFYNNQALQRIVDVFDNGANWAVSGCIHDDGTTVSRPHFPKWTPEILKGVNTIGSPSVLAFRNDNPLLFDERMSWMLDLDLYRRLYDRYGEPTVINYIDIGIGVGEHQMTNLLSLKEKIAEEELFHGTTN